MSQCLNFCLNICLKLRQNLRHFVSRHFVLRHFVSTFLNLRHFVLSTIYRDCGWCKCFSDNWSRLKSVRGWRNIWGDFQTSWMLLFCLTCIGICVCIICIGFLNTASRELLGMFWFRLNYQPIIVFLCLAKIPSGKGLVRKSAGCSSDLMWWMVISPRSTWSGA